MILVYYMEMDQVHFLMNKIVLLVELTLEVVAIHLLLNQFVWCWVLKVQVCPVLSKNDVICW